MLLYNNNYLERFIYQLCFDSSNYSYWGIIVHMNYLKKLITPIALATGIFAASPAQAQDKKEEPAPASIQDVLDEGLIAKLYVKGEGLVGKDISSWSQYEKAVLALGPFRFTGAYQHRTTTTDGDNKQITKTDRGYLGLGGYLETPAGKFYGEAAGRLDVIDHEKTAEGTYTKTIFTWLAMQEA